MSPHISPFIVAGELKPEQMIDRDHEANELATFGQSGQPFRLHGPRRYGKTTLLTRALNEAAQAGMATVLVDLEGVLSLEGVVVRIERAYDKRLRNPLRRTVDKVLRSWNIGLGLGGGGFTAALQMTPNLHIESVLLRLLDLPLTLYERTGQKSFIVFDEVQDLLQIQGAAGTLRSVIQHHHIATYGFAGSAPGLMNKMFADPSQPFLEHALPIELGPLPLDVTGEYIEQYFLATNKQIGPALDPLLEFTRGHPQRTMLLAHHTWRLTAAGKTADETTWSQALEHTTKASDLNLQTRWQSLPINEQRLLKGIANSTYSLYDERTYRPVGLKKGSIDTALVALINRGELITTDDGPRITDPLFEYWLHIQGKW